MHITKEGRHSHTLTKDSPCTSFSQPCAVCTCCPHGNLPWAPELACSAHFGLRASFSGSLILPLPTLGFTHIGSRSWGTHGACSPCPYISIASQASAQLPHTDLALHLLLLPRAGHGLVQRPASKVSCVWQQHLTKCAAAHGARTRSQLPS